jgi:hypothetical protein
MKKQTPKKGRFFVGSLGVDSGLIFLSDPCYIKHHPELYNEVVEN